MDAQFAPYDPPKHGKLDMHNGKAPIPITIYRKVRQYFTIYPMYEISDPYCASHKVVWFAADIELED